MDSVKNMPYIVNISFKAIDNVTLDIVNSGRITQKYFYDAISKSEPQLAWIIHNINTIKPFTVTRITTKKTLVKGIEITIPKGEILKMTIKLLTDDLLDYLLQGINQLEEYQIGKSKIKINDILIKGETYQELNQTPPAQKITINYITPTYFAKNYNYPFPPEKIIKSWAYPWNQYAPKHLKIKNIEETAKCPKTTTPTKGKPHAPKLYLTEKQITIKAYTGTQTLTLKYCNKQQQKTITTLAKYANYTGTGRMTRMGLGTTKTKTI